MFFSQLGRERRARSATVVLDVNSQLPLCYQSSLTCVLR
jgi:hypothetical protein